LGSFAYGVGSVIVIGDLAEALVKDSSKEVRIKAARSLGMHGPAAAVAVPALRRVLKEKDTDIRDYAVNVLRSIGPGAKIAVPDLVEMLQDKNNDQRLRECAGFALGDIGPDAKAAVPELLELLSSGDEQTKQMTLYPLGKIGDAAAIPALLSILEDKNQPVVLRAGAAASLGHIGPKAKAAIPALVKGLDVREVQDPLMPSHYHRLQFNSIYALGLMGTAAETTIPDLAKIVKDTKLDSTVRHAATRALIQIGPASLRTLIEVLKDPQCEAAHESISQSLAEMGASAVPHLAELAKHSDQRVRFNAVRASAAMKPLPKEAIPALTKALNDEVFGIRVTAERALERSKP
jgi:HEAT repeat protein